jgi:hypothetical protein
VEITVDASSDAEALENARYAMRSAETPWCRVDVVTMDVRREASGLEVAGADGGEDLIERSRRLIG